MFPSISRASALIRSQWRNKFEVLPHIARSFCAERNNEHEVEESSHIRSPEELIGALNAARRSSSPLERSKVWSKLKPMVPHFSFGMTAEQAVDTLVVLSDLGSSLMGKACCALLKVIEVNIADLQLEATLRLAHLLNKANKIFVVETVLPMLFARDLKAQFELLSHGDKVEALLYSLSTRVEFPFRSESIQFIAQHFSDLHRPKIPADKAECILASMLRLDQKADNSAASALASVMDRVLCDQVDELELNQIAKLLSFYTNLRGTPSLFAERVLERVTRQSENWETEIHIFNVLSSIRSQRVRAAEHLIGKLEKSPSALACMPLISLDMVTRVLRWANTLPPSWEETLWPEIKKNPAYAKLGPEYWFSIAVNLLSVDFVDRELVARLLSLSYLQQVFDKSPEKQNWLLFWEIAQHCVLNPELFPEQAGIVDSLYMKNAIVLKRIYTRCPIHEKIEAEFGSELVVSKVTSKYGHFIQHILKYDVKNERFEPFEAADRDEGEGCAELEKFATEGDVKLIAVNALEEYNFVGESHEPIGRARIPQKGLAALQVVPVLLNMQLLDATNIRDSIVQIIRSALDAVK